MPPLAAVFALVLAAAPGPAAEPVPDPSENLLWESVDESLQSLPTEELERVLTGLDEEVRRHLPPLDLRELVRDPEGGLRLDPRQLLEGALGTVWRELRLQSRLLGQLLIVAALCALLQTAAGPLASRGAAELAFLVAFLLVVFLAVQSFRVAADLGRQTLDGMVSLMLALLPMLATLLAAVGALSSAALFHPLLLTLVTGIATLIEQVVIPLLFTSAALAVTGHLAPDFPLSRLSQLVRQAGVTLLGLAFAVFLGLLAVRGAIAPVADGIALRTAKFLTGTFVPVVGGWLADAAEVVAGGSLLIKNALGAFGLAALLVMAVFPLAKLAALVVIYRAVTALIQPVADARLVSCLGSIADILVVLGGSVACAALMFFVALTVLVGVGNLAVVLR